MRKGSGEWIEESAECGEWIEERLEQMKKAQQIIAELKAKYSGKNWIGKRKCPVCGGVLHLQISAYNGHVHGQCEKPGCLSWME